MQKVRITLVAFLCLVLTSTAQSQGMPRGVNVRYSEQIANGPAGACGCFALQGAAADAYWKLGRIPDFGLAADIGAEHTGSVDGAAYGLTLTTFTAGPRFVLPARKAHVFAQVLFGLAHGSGSEFPEHSTLVSSANSFALDLGGGADYPLNKRLWVRILQLDYLRTALPNNTTNWQNNLRIGAGLTLKFSH